MDLTKEGFEIIMDLEQIMFGLSRQEHLDISPVGWVPIYKNLDEDLLYSFQYMELSLDDLWHFMKKVGIYTVEPRGDIHVKDRHKLMY